MTPAERLAELASAREALARAHAALVLPDACPSEILAFALLETSLALLHLANADTDQAARKAVEERIRKAQARHSPF